MNNPILTKLYIGESSSISINISSSTIYGIRRTKNLRDMLEQALDEEFYPSNEV